MLLDSTKERPLILCTMACYNQYIAIMSGPIMEIQYWVLRTENWVQSSQLYISSKLWRNIRKLVR